MDLICPAGNLQSLKAAVDSGADAVYIGFRDDTNARHFAGLNFDDRQAAEGVAHAHRRGAMTPVNSNPIILRLSRDVWAKCRPEQRADPVQGDNFGYRPPTIAPATTSVKLAMSSQGKGPPL